MALNESYAPNTNIKAKSVTETPHRRGAILRGNVENRVYSSHPSYCYEDAAK